MHNKWTSHLNTIEEKENFAKYIRGSRGILDRLSSITEEWKAEIDSKDLSNDLYDSPGWAAQQADNNGQRRMLRKFQQLLNLDQKEK